MPTDQVTPQTARSAPEQPGADSAEAGRGEVLWEPPADVLDTTRMGDFLRWLRQERGREFTDYPSLWQWSVNELDEFWGAVAQYFQVRFHDRPKAVLGRRSMPGAEWFPGATLNFAEHVLAGPHGAVVLISRSETRPRMQLTRGEVRAQVAALQAQLRRSGVRPGDRVAGYLPNIPEALVSLLAVTGLGAVFSSCAPESGTASVISRIGQVEPRVLVTVDGYVYGGAPHDRLDEVEQIRRAVPSIETTLSVPYLYAGENRVPDSQSWSDLPPVDAAPEFVPVPFAHPLYIVFSSGTTGKPKPIVHGHGGVLLEHLKLFLLHDNLGPDDRYFWYSSTNWMAWNYGVSSLLSGGSLLTFDGHPMRPELADYWRMIGEERVTYLGTSPAFMGACQKAGVVPREVADLRALRAVTSGGSPLSAAGWRWVYSAVKDDVYLSSTSGGTDVASSFVAGCRLLPVRAGEITCRVLGTDAQAVDEGGRVVVGQRGELVIRAPMPSMPVGFWGDTDGELMRQAYFDRFPEVWCHGDWITFSPEGTCQVTGRSDATLNRGGVRLGTSEFYAVVDEIADIGDSLVIHLEDPDNGPGELILFVTLVEGGELDDELRDRVNELLRRQLSPRHVPDVIEVVHSIPRTLSGKRQEIPVKRALIDPGHTAPGAGENDGLEEFRGLGRSRRARAAGTTS